MNADGYLTTGQGVLSYNMFAYCGNNPVVYSDPTGQFSILAISVVYAIVAASLIIYGCTKARQIQNDDNRNAIDKQIKENYTKEQAKKEIETSLSKYSTKDKNIEVNFNSSTVEITNSYLVDSKYDRQKVSMIITRTETTTRSYDSLSAEWNVHNFMYDIMPENSTWKEKSKDVNLDYTGDERVYVRVASSFFEVMEWD